MRYKIKTNKDLSNVEVGTFSKIATFLDKKNGKFAGFDEDDKAVFYLTLSSEPTPKSVNNAAGSSGATFSCIGVSEADD